MCAFFFFFFCKIHSASAPEACVPHMKSCSASTSKTSRLSSKVYGIKRIHAIKKKSNYWYLYPNTGFYACTAFEWDHGSDLNGAKWQHLGLQVIINTSSATTAQWTPRRYLRAITETKNKNKKHYFFSSNPKFVCMIFFKQTRTKIFLLN